MRVMQTSLPIAVLATSLMLVVIAVMDGKYLSAFAWILGCLAIQVCLLGISRPWDDDAWLFKVLAMVTTICAIFAAFSGSAATDSRRQAAQLELRSFYLNVMGGMYGQVSPVANKMAEVGVRRCAVQGYLDLADLAHELHKAQHLGPGSSLALGTYEQLAGADKPPPSCIASFVEFNRVAPDVAKVFLHRYPEVLTYK